MRTNPLLMDIVRMRVQGMSPMAARQQLVQKYPQLRNMQPFMQGQTPQEMDNIAKNTATSMGLDPQRMMANIQGLVSRK